MFFTTSQTISVITMPRCQKCGERVSQRYSDVKWDGGPVVPACPNCDDAEISNGEYREYRG